MSSFDMCNSDDCLKLNGPNIILDLPCKPEPEIEVLVTGPPVRYGKLRLYNS